MAQHSFPIKEILIAFIEHNGSFRDQLLEQGVTASPAVVVSVEGDELARALPEALKRTLLSDESVFVVDFTQPAAALVGRQSFAGVVNRYHEPDYFAAHIANQTQFCPESLLQEIPVDLLEYDQWLLKHWKLLHANALTCQGFAAMEKLVSALMQMRSSSTGSSERIINLFFLCPDLALEPIFNTFFSVFMKLSSVRLHHRFRWWLIRNERENSLESNFHLFLRLLTSRGAAPLSAQLCWPSPREVALVLRKVNSLTKSMDVAADDFDEIALEVFLLLKEAKEHHRCGPLFDPVLLFELFEVVAPAFQSLKMALLAERSEMAKQTFEVEAKQPSPALLVEQLVNGEIIQVRRYLLNRLVEKPLSLFELTLFSATYPWDNDDVSEDCAARLLFSHTTGPLLFALLCQALIKRLTAEQKEQARERWRGFVDPPPQAELVFELAFGQRSALDSLLGIENVQQFAMATIFTQVGKSIPTKQIAEITRAQLDIFEYLHAPIKRILTVTTYAIELARQGAFSLARRWMQEALELALAPNAGRHLSQVQHCVAAVEIRGGLVTQELSGWILRALANARATSNRQQEVRALWLDWFASFYLQEPKSALEKMQEIRNFMQQNSIRFSCEESLLPLFEFLVHLDCAWLTSSENQLAGLRAVIKQHLELVSEALRLAQQDPGLVNDLDRQWFVSGVERFCQFFLRDEHAEMTVTLDLLGRSLFGAQADYAPMLADMIVNLCHASEQLGSVPSRIARHAAAWTGLKSMLQGWNDRAHGSRFLASHAIQALLGQRCCFDRSELQQLIDLIAASVEDFRCLDDNGPSIAVALGVALNAHSVLIDRRDNSLSKCNEVIRVERTNAVSRRFSRSTGLAWKVTNSVNTWDESFTSKSPLASHETVGWIVTLERNAILCSDKADLVSLFIQFDEPAWAESIFSVITTTWNFRLFLMGIRASQSTIINERRSEEIANMSRTIAEQRSKSATELSELLSVERKKLKDLNVELRELNTARSRFFAALSHDLKTPLTLSMGLLEKLQDPVTALPPEYLDLTRICLRNQNQMLKMINSLLLQARMESGSPVVRASRFEAMKVVRRVAEQFSFEADKQKIVFRFLDQTDGVQVCCDEDHFEQIVFNLLSNSFKSCKDNAEICIDMSYVKIGSRTKGLIVFSDSGIGFDPALLGFELIEASNEDRDGKKRRYRPNNALRATEIQAPVGLQQAESGLGLALSGELVTLNHGELALESMPGLGSRFEILLPIPEGLVAPLDAHSEELPRFETIVPSQVFEVPREPLHCNPALPNVLVVEDHPEVRQLLHTLLAQQHNTYFAYDGIDALESLGIRRPDIIVADFALPRCDGLELLRTIRNDQKNKSIPFIMLTARGDATTRWDSLEAGVSDFMTKPFIPQELLLRIQNLVALARMRDAMEDDTARSRVAEVAVGIDHEMSNPMQVIALCLEELQEEEANLSEESRKLLYSIEEQLTRLQISLKKLNSFKAWFRGGRSDIGLTNQE